MLTEEKIAPTKVGSKLLIKYTMAITSFRRIEKKYLVTEEEKQALLPLLYQHMILDPYCPNESTYRIQNIYFDTENNTLITHSLAKPVYKEKLRIRKYDGEDNVYLEIKKKCLDVVGKRRISLSMQEADDFILRGIKPVKLRYVDNEIIQEMTYFFSLYSLLPKVYISYERLGFFDQNDHDFRLTFDNQIHARRSDLSWDENHYEDDLLDKSTYIMEVKSVKNFPLWLTNALSELKIYPHSFSKYGVEYQHRKHELQEEEKPCSKV